VVVVDREPELGGMPRQCANPGFPWGPLPLRSGPAFARALVAEARAAGVELHAETTVLGWQGDRALEATSPRGLLQLSASAILLATGCRERPRGARLVPGTRPAGVITMGGLQRLLGAGAGPVGARAVVVGAEAVSFGAAWKLARTGTEVVAMLTDDTSHQCPPLLAWGARLAGGAPLLCRARVIEILGARRVSGVVVDVAGAERRLDCDTVVFSGDFTPEHELAHAGGLVLDPGTRGPRVDPGLHTSRPGVFAAGNLLRGAEPADVAAAEGRAAAAAIAELLGAGGWPEARVEVFAEPPLAWIAPSWLPPFVTAPALRVRTRVRHARATLLVRQGDRQLSAVHVGSLVPNRTTLLPGGWVPGAGAPVRITLEGVGAGPG
jgi:NADPH-dependent 2,4-dienoyl-CoA reductase/sulfur reductase-like enzyme